MTEKVVLTSDELKGRAARFFSRYGRELEQIRELLSIRLSQLALAYTIRANLPPEAITVISRVKSLESFIKKLERKSFPQFYYPTEVAGDLIGARVICWFIDDCHEMRKLIESSKHLSIRGDIEDYINNPKVSGYRSIHLVGEIGYDAVRRHDDSVGIADDKMSCEIQIRTKIQDAWGDLTHEFHYKAQTAGVQHAVYERFMADVSRRLAFEDESLVTLRNAYQELAEEKLQNKTREGFRDD